MSNADSVKDRLKNYAKQNDRTFQDVLTMYVLERVLYRISLSPFAKNFTLKGGILLYGMYNNDFSRATTDIDLLGSNISNDEAHLRSVFQEILRQETTDPITFDINAIKISNITELRKYHGIRISTFAFLDRTRIPVSIDVGFGDIVFPSRVEMQYQTVLNDDAPQLFAYSIYTIVAEKFEAIVSLGVLNSRYKDFYDLCTLSERENFDGGLLQAALIETFKNRHTEFAEIAAFSEQFAHNQTRLLRWKGFLRSKRVTEAKTFEHAISTVKHFLLPVIDAIREHKPFLYEWHCSDMTWHEKDTYPEHMH